MAFSVKDARDDLLRKLGIEDAAQASAAQLADVALAINWALQTLFSAGEDFFTRSKLSVAFSAGIAAVELPSTVQEVLGPVRLPTGVPLRMLSSRGELDAFGVLFLGQESWTVAQSLPQAYWVESLRASSGADLAKIVLNIVPAPSSSITLTVEGVEECANIAVAGLGATDALAVPHQYAESIFLPLARQAITRSTSFSRAELRREIQADFERAMATLGAKGGFPPEKQPETREAKS